MNRLKSLVLLATLTALLLWAGQELGGQDGLLIALVLAGAMNFGGYWSSDRIVLRMYGARELSHAEASQLYTTVRELAARALLPMPKLYLIPEDAPNAFAAGRNPEHAVVAVTQGLLRTLHRDEVAAVIAHELGHIRNRDTLIMTLAAALAGALSMLANMAMWSSLLGGRSSDEDDGGTPLGGPLGVMIAPIAATLVQLAISRSREFFADETAARISRNPLALASALREIEILSRQAPMHSGSPATAHLFIQNPFTAGGLARDVQHPPADRSPGRAAGGDGCRAPAVALRECPRNALKRIRNA
jgi:heat shock protein HtpX